MKPEITLRAHPLMIVRYLWRYLFVLLIPVVRGLLNYGRSGTLSHLVAGEAALGAVIVAVAVLKWSRCRVIIARDRLTVRTGLFLSRTAVVPLGHIASALFEYNPVLALFGAVAVRIDTEAGGRKNADFALILTRRAARTLRRAVSPDAPATLTYRCRTLRLVLLAAANSSAAAGLLIAAPVINKAGQLLGENLSDRLMGTITYAAMLTERLIPPAATVLALVMVAGFVVSFLLTLFQCAPFRLRRRGGRLDITHGLVTHRHTCFSMDAVNAVVIQQSFLMRLARHCTVNVSVAGYGKQKGESAALLPAADAAQADTLTRRILPGCERLNLTLRPPKRAFQRVLFVPVVALAAIPMGTLILCLLFPVVSSMLAFLAMVAQVVVAYFLSVRIRCYRRGGVGFWGGVQAYASKWLRLIELRAAPGRTGVIRIMRNPFDKLVHLCSVRVTLRAEGALSLTVLNLDDAEVLKEIERVYGV